MRKGRFITFEGIDGCGKSTQIGIAQKFLNDMGYETMIVREPGGTVVGEKIRTILLDKKNDSMVSMTELLLYEAARAQIVEEKIIPALEAGTMVICDRFYDSTAAYQGYARGLGTDLVETLNDIAAKDCSPDITFLLDLTPRQALERRKARGEDEDRLEAMGTSFQEKVRDGYLLWAKSHPRIRTIDASVSVEQIGDEVISCLSAIL
ncbi:MAG: dTMP kinase [Clostridiales bacterium]|nr:dTMP kinase [Clostridiales bacterium]